MPLSPTSLHELLERTAQGDHAAFEQVYARTHTHLFGLTLRMLGQRQTAEDVLQEAFINIWKNASSYRREVAGQSLQPMTWLIAIVRNKALDTLRAQARRPALDGGADSPPQPPHEAAPSALELWTQATTTLGIAGCVDGLEAAHRQSLALAYYQGYSHSEVAASMGAPLGSVKTWIRRGLQRLAHCLDAHGIRP